MMDAPDILKVRNPRDLKFIVSSWEVEMLYDRIRYTADNTKMLEDGTIRYDYNSVTVIADNYSALGDEHKGSSSTLRGPRIGLYLNYNNADDGKYTSNIAMTVYITNAVGQKMPTAVIWEFDSATVENVNGDHDNVRITLKDHGKPVATFYSYKRREFRHRQGEFVFDGRNLKSKKQIENGGCRMCDHAVYEKENGIIYLKCTKYNGRVAEMEYDGEKYPSYCKRRK